MARSLPTAVFGDAVGGEGAFSGAQQGGAGVALVCRDMLGRGFGFVRVGDSGSPVTGEDRVVRGAPGAQPGPDELGWRRDVFWGEQQAGGLVEHARSVIERVGDVAVAPTGTNAGRPDVA